MAFLVLSMAGRQTNTDSRGSNPGLRFSPLASKGYFSNYPQGQRVRGLVHFNPLALCQEDREGVKEQVPSQCPASQANQVTVNV